MCCCSSEVAFCTMGCLLYSWMMLFYFSGKESHYVKHSASNATKLIMGSCPCLFTTFVINFLHFLPYLPYKLNGGMIFSHYNHRFLYSFKLAKTLNMLEHIGESMDN